MSSETPVTAQESNTTQIYLSNLPFNLSEAQLVDFFQSQIGVAPSKLTIPPGGFPRSRAAPVETGEPFPSSSVRRNRGFAFAVFRDEEVEKVLSLNKALLLEREVGVAKAEEKTEEEKAAARERRQEQLSAQKEARKAKKASQASSSVSPSPSDHQDALRVYVNNIPFASTEQEVKEFFENNGLNVADMKIVYSTYRRPKKTVEEGQEETEEAQEGEEKPERTKRSRGFGFLTLEDEESKEQALKLNEIEFHERALLIQALRPKKVRAAAVSSAEGGEEGEKKKKKGGKKKKAAAAEGETAGEPSSSASPVEGETAEGGEKKKRKRNRKPRKAKQAEGETVAETAETTAE